jgi:hypothetical protein
MSISKRCCPIETGGGGERGRGTENVPPDEPFHPADVPVSFLEKIAVEYGAVSCTNRFSPTGRRPVDASKPVESVVEKSFMQPAAKMYGPMEEKMLSGIAKPAEAINWTERYTTRMSTVATPAPDIKMFKRRLNELIYRC